MRFQSMLPWLWPDKIAMIQWLITIKGCVLLYVPASISDDSNLSMKDKSREKVR
jgi:hypothetical protein